MRSFEEILKLCDVDLEFYEAVMELESRESGKDFDSIYSFMASMLDAMEQSVDSALNTEFKGRLMEDEARRFGKYISQTEDLLSGKFIANASHIALAVSQYNSNMGASWLPLRQEAVGYYPGCSLPIRIYMHPPGMRW